MSATGRQVSSDGFTGRENREVSYSNNKKIMISITITTIIMIIMIVILPIKIQ